MPTSETWQRPTETSPLPNMGGSVKTATPDHPFWKKVAEDWHQDQLAQAALRWQQCVESCPTNGTPYPTYITLGSKHGGSEHDTANIQCM